MNIENTTHIMRILALLLLGIYLANLATITLNPASAPGFLSVPLQFMLMLVMSFLFALSLMTDPNITRLGSTTEDEAT